jgi:hypothetical protein
VGRDSIKPVPSADPVRQLSVRTQLVITGVLLVVAIPAAVEAPLFL